MRPVGIIANPASGKDIRRLAAFGSVFDNNEKVRIVRRVLLGLDAMGVEEVVLMPDSFGIGIRALEDLEIKLKPVFLDGAIEGTQDDTTIAAGKFRDMDAACIITLGGDGTNRAAAKESGNTPLLPISTGTNNVFPSMTESTLAGLAAGILAVRPEYRETCVRSTPRLDIKRNGQMVDLALIDVVVSKPGFIGARALWEVSSLREIFLARPEPGHIGFSSVGGHLGLTLEPDQGVYLKIGPGPKTVLAPIAPGLIRPVPIESYKVISPGEEIPITRTPALAALDGERELSIKAGDDLVVALDSNGPPVVDIAAAIARASNEGIFTEQ